MCPISVRRTTFIIGVCCFAVALHGQAADESTVLDERLAVLRGEKPSQWLIQPYKPSYILPFTYFDEPNEAQLNEPGGIGNPEDELDDVEVKFQISFMMPLWEDIPKLDANLYFAYT